STSKLLERRAGRFPLDAARARWDVAGAGFRRSCIMEGFNVKRSVLVLLLAATPALVRPAAAQVWGQYTSAETVPVNGHMFGGYLHASSNFLGLLAQLRLSFYPNVDFGFQ